MIKKRGAVLAAVVLMLSVAVYLNWSYTKGETEELLVSNQAETGKTLGEAKLVDSIVTETDEAALNDGVFRFQTAAAFGGQGKVQYHDGILLHDADEHDDAHEGSHVQFRVEKPEAEQRSESGGRQA